jgi:hypothetical protein
MELTEEDMEKMTSFMSSAGKHFAKNCHKVEAECLNDPNKDWAISLTTSNINMNDKTSGITFFRFSEKLDGNPDPLKFGRALIFAVSARKTNIPMIPFECEVIRERKKSPFIVIKDSGETELFAPCWYGAKVTTIDEAEAAVYEKDTAILLKHMEDSLDGACMSQMMPPFFEEEESGDESDSNSRA